MNLNINDEFTGVHGLLEDGSSHEEHEYNVVGILKPSGTVVDRLILTIFKFRFKYSWDFMK